MIECAQDKADMGSIPCSLCGGGISIPFVDQNTKFDQIGSDFVDHILAISLFLVHLSLRM